MDLFQNLSTDIQKAFSWTFKPSQNYEYIYGKISNSCKLPEFKYFLGAIFFNYQFRIVDASEDCEQKSERQKYISLISDLSICLQKFT